MLRLRMIMSFTMRRACYHASMKSAPSPFRRRLKAKVQAFASLPSDREERRAYQKAYLKTWTHGEAAVQRYQDWLISQHGTVSKDIDLNF
jgi:hypothetical protein